MYHVSNAKTTFMIDPSLLTACNVIAPMVEPEPDLARICPLLLLSSKTRCFSSYNSRNVYGLP